MFILFIFLAMFMLKMYSQNDEMGVWEVLEKKNSLLPNHGGKTFTEFFKNFLHGFYNSLVVSLSVSWR